jgi:hypothetical protein
MKPGGTLLEYYKDDLLQRNAQEENVGNIKCVTRRW